MPQIPDGAAAAVLIAGGTVGACAAAATAHGLYEVSVAALVPAGIAVLYPVITDGLALVAYAASERLTGVAAAYAWAVVVLAAGLSGLAQASYLASADGPSGELHLSGAVRFGIGVWPAVAAALVAHLLFLIGNSASARRPADGPSANAQLGPNATQQAGETPAPDRGVPDQDLEDRVPADRLHDADQHDRDEADPEPDGDADADEEPLPADPAVFADRELEAGRTAGQKKIHARYPHLNSYQARQTSEKARARFAERHTFRPSVVAGGEQR